MSSFQQLRGFIRDRLTAAAAEIFIQVEKTIVRYEEDIKLLEKSFKPQIKLTRIDEPKQNVSNKKEVLTDPEIRNQQSLDQQEPEPQEVRQNQQEPEPQEVRQNQQEPELQSIGGKQQQHDHIQIKGNQKEPEFGKTVIQDQEIRKLNMCWIQLTRTGFPKQHEALSDQREPEPPQFTEEPEPTGSDYLQCDDDQKNPEGLGVKEDEEDVDLPQSEEELGEPEPEPEPPEFEDGDITSEFMDIKTDPEEPEPMKIKEDQDKPEPPQIKVEQEEPEPEPEPPQIKVEQEEPEPEPEPPRSDNEHEKPQQIQQLVSTREADAFMDPLASYQPEPDEEQLHHQNHPEPQQLHHQNHQEPQQLHHQNHPEPQQLHHQNRPEPQQLNHQNHPEPQQLHHQNHPEPQQLNHQNHPEPQQLHHQNHQEPQQLHHQNHPEPQQLNHQNHPEPQQLHHQNHQEPQQLHHQNRPEPQQLHHQNHPEPQQLNHQNHPEPQQLHHQNHPEPQQLHHQNHPEPQQLHHQNHPEPQQLHHQNRPEPQQLNHQNRQEPQQLHHQNHPEPQRLHHQNHPEPQQLHHQNRPEPQQLHHQNHPEPQQLHHQNHPEPQQLHHQNHPEPQHRFCSGAALDAEQITEECNGSEPPPVQQQRKKLCSGWEAEPFMAAGSQERGWIGPEPEQIQCQNPAEEQQSFIELKTFYSCHCQQMQEEPEAPHLQQQESVRSWEEKLLMASTCQHGCFQPEPGGGPLHYQNRPDHRHRFMELYGFHSGVTPGQGHYRSEPVQNPDREQLVAPTRPEDQNQGGTSSVGSERRSDTVKLSQCYVCSAVVKSQSLNQHLKTHPGVKPYVCQRCGQRFAQHADLRDHKMTHLVDQLKARQLAGVRSRQKNFFCEICQRGFAELAYLKNHHFTAHRWEQPFCETCGKHFTSEHSLKSHLKIHQRKRPKPFYCGLCKKRFACHSTKKSHMKRHKEQEPISYETWRKTSNTTKPVSHRQSPSAEETLFCRICKRLFLYRTSYIAHMKFHKNPANSCRKCGKSFKDKQKLAAHRKSHKKKPAFICSKCGKHFEDKSEAGPHMRSCGKLYGCEKCGNRFSSWRGVKSHQKRGHCRGDVQSGK